MVIRIETSDNAAAFRTAGEVTAYDYRTVIKPSIKAVMEKADEINLLFLVENEIGKSSAGWMEDCLLGLRSLGKWNRAAVVTHCEMTIHLAKAFRYIVSGEFRWYTVDRLQEALLWVEGKEHLIFPIRQDQNLPAVEELKENK